MKCHGMLCNPLASCGGILLHNLAYYGGAASQRRSSRGAFWQRGRGSACSGEPWSWSLLAERSWGHAIEGADIGEVCVTVFVVTLLVTEILRVLMRRVILYAPDQIPLEQPWLVANH